MELSTIARHGLNPIVVVLNNHGYTTERFLLEGPFNDIHDWAYHQIPEVLGAGLGLEIRTVGELDAGPEDRAGQHRQLQPAERPPRPLRPQPRARAAGQPAVEDRGFPGKVSRFHAVPFACRAGARRASAVPGRSVLAQTPRRGNATSGEPTFMPSTSACLWRNATGAKAPAALARGTRCAVARAPTQARESKSRSGSLPASTPRPPRACGGTPQRPGPPPALPHARSAACGDTSLSAPMRHPLRRNSIGDQLARRCPRRTSPHSTSGRPQACATSPRRTGFSWM